MATAERGFMFWRLLFYGVTGDGVMHVNKLQLYWLATAS